MNRISTIVIPCLIACLIINVMACAPRAEPPLVESPTAQPPRANSHDLRRQSAIEQALKIVTAQQPTPSSNALVQFGDALLRGGRCEEAVQQFERAIALSPESEPYLWQHGIALFFVGRFDDAASLFEKHRVVNPNDVENAAWHFLCVAKSKDVTRARKILLPAPGDARVPMEEVLQRLPGGEFTAIENAVEQTRDTLGYASAKFYGDLYIGMIADAEGNRSLAKKYLSESADTELPHYMADVARVYAARVKP